MDVNELYQEFNLVFNNLGSNIAPGLDKYEISVYLTKSQDIVEDALYREFEHSEEARKKLSNMVVQVDRTASNDVSSHKLTSDSTMFKLPDDLRYIVNERIKMNQNADRCIRSKFVEIQPCLHDEVDRMMKNPYRYNMFKALRLDTSVNGEKYSEIVSKDSNIDFYRVRYIKKCNPIILTDLSSGEFEGMGLSINGQTAVSQASLDESLHRQIVEMAAKMAYADYKS